MGSGSIGGGGTVGSVSRGVIGFVTLLMPELRFALLEVNAGLNAGLTAEESMVDKTVLPWGSLDCLCGPCLGAVDGR